MENVWILKKELERKEKENQIHSALERKLVDAFTSSKTEVDTRIRLAELLDDWENRS